MVHAGRVDRFDVGGADVHRINGRVYRSDRFSAVDRAENRL